MSYVIFNLQTTIRHDHRKSYATEGAAKMVLTKLQRAGKLDENWVVDSMEDFAKIEKTEVVYNLMSGQPVTQSVNTPLCCDVSSETYWSM